MKNMKILCAAAIALGATTSFSTAQIVAYQDNFEDRDINAVLINNEFSVTDDWVVGANVWDEFYFSYLYNYFSFPAPNNNGISGTGVDAFSAITTGEGGPDQGAQQLSVYSDYNNGDLALGYYLEANFFREYLVDAANIGETWTFSFDSKQGNIGLNTDPLANATGFIKTINPPANGGTFNLTNFEAIDLTNASVDWTRYELSLEITPDLEGQLFQIGWLNLSANYDPSGMFYDNVDLSNGSAQPCPADINGDGILDNGDIGAFVAAFLAGDIAVDFNGDGILDNGDISAFVAAFLAGCE